jgi:hypothetical protein
MAPLTVVRGVAAEGAATGAADGAAEAAVAGMMPRATVVARAAPEAQSLVENFMSVTP